MYNETLMFEDSTNTLQFQTKYDIKLLTVIQALSDGARHKTWCEDAQGVKYLYKRDKPHISGESTYESVAEKLAELIGKQVQVRTVPIILGDHEILSQALADLEEIRNFVEMSEELSHSFHMSNLDTYQLGTLLSTSNPFLRDTVFMLLFDILIGNSDRHPANFAYAYNKFYPLFDNGSSLCAYVRESQIDEILRDDNRFNALCLTKSKPTIRGESKLTHHQLLQQLTEDFPLEVAQFAHNLDSINWKPILKMVPISDKRQELLQRFLDVRQAWFKEANNGICKK